MKFPLRNGGHQVPTIKLTLFAVSKDGTSKSMRNALYAQRYMVKGTSWAEATLNSKKNQNP